MPKNRAREAVNRLWERLVVNMKDVPISEDTGGIDSNFLAQIKVDRHPLELDSHGVVSTDANENPPFLFELLPAQRLIDVPELHEVQPFQEYLQPLERPAEDRGTEWTSEARGTEISSYVTEFAFTIPGAAKHLATMSYPDPFLLGGGIDSSGPYFWRTHALLEANKSDGQPTSPHVIMTVVQDEVDRNGSILIGELGPLISAMRCRANQPKVPPEKWKKLFKHGQQDFPEKPRVFPNEKTFPVLMLSFQGPQHARVFYACMRDDRLIIRQSRLFSFERMADAPVELFARLLLSSPVSE